VDRSAPDTSDDAKSALRLWLKLYRPVAMIERDLRSRFQREFGVSLSRFDVLSALDRAEDGLLMGELSDRLLVTNGNVTGLISRLVADGLVERQALTEDRRSFRVRLTVAGRAVFSDMAAANEDWMAEILGDLPDETASALNTHMDTLMRHARIGQTGT
jgi:DNA-binding MarR family transcriptional regulator